MSKTYQDLINTFYPDGEDTFEAKIDATAEMQPHITAYKNYFNAGNMSAAKDVLDKHPELKSMIITAADFNRLQEAILALCRFATRAQQQIIFSATQPSGQTVGDVWINIAENNAVYLLTEEGYVNQGMIGATDDYVTVNTFNATMNGTWIDFYDEYGNSTDEPYIHWNVDENGKPIKPITTYAETQQF